MVRLDTLDIVAVSVFRNVHRSWLSSTM